MNADAEQAALILGEPLVEPRDVFLDVDGRLRGGDCRAELGELKAMYRDPGMPSERAVLRWSIHRPEFRRQYGSALKTAGWNWPIPG